MKKKYRNLIPRLPMISRSTLRRDILSIKDLHELINKLDTSNFRLQIRK